MSKPKSTVTSRLRVGIWYVLRQCRTKYSIHRNFSGAGIGGLILAGETFLDDSSEVRE